jgi:hypothetical protein
MSGNTAAWLIPLTLAHFTMLLVVALERPRHGEQGRHRRDLAEVPR